MAELSCHRVKRQDRWAENSGNPGQQLAYTMNDRFGSDSAI